MVLFKLFWWILMLPVPQFFQTLLFQKKRLFGKYYYTSVPDLSNFRRFFQNISEMFLFSNMLIIYADSFFWNELMSWNQTNVLTLDVVLNKSLLTVIPFMEYSGICGLCAAKRENNSIESKKHWNIPMWLNSFKSKSLNCIWNDISNVI